MSKNHVELTPAVGPNDHAQGPADAPMTLVEYGDYECPYCGMAYPSSSESRRGWANACASCFATFRSPTAHPHAMRCGRSSPRRLRCRASSGRCTTRSTSISARSAPTIFSYAESSVWISMHFEARASHLARRIKRVRADFTSGVRSGVNGTPTFFINGRRFDGDWRDEEILAAALG